MNFRWSDWLVEGIIDWLVWGDTGDGDSDFIVADKPPNDTAKKKKDTVITGQKEVEQVGNVEMRLYEGERFEK
jgi:hypothetical protein